MTKATSIVEIRTDPKEARRKINAANKRRGKQMETDVSKIFLGNTRGKVAASGAGQQKGDNWIPLPNQSGYLYIECKTSEHEDRKLGKGVPLQFKFFDKVVSDNKAMGGRLGTLAVKWHNKSLIVIFFREQDIDIVRAIGGKEVTFSGPIVGRTHTLNGKELKNHTVYLEAVQKAFKESIAGGDVVPNVRFRTPSGIWVGVDVYQLKELLGYS